MNENTETQYDYERLKKVVCEQINNTLKDNFLYTKTGENQWEYNIEADYRDEFSQKDIFTILSAEHPTESFEEIMDDYFWREMQRLQQDLVGVIYCTPDPELQEFIKTVKDIKELISDIIWDHVCFNYPYDHFLNQTAYTNIYMDVNESQNDFTLNSAKEDRDKGTLKLLPRGSLYWLINQQGHSLEEFNEALNNEEEPENQFLASCLDELDNQPSGQAVICFLVKLPLKHLIQIKEHENKEEAIVLDKKVICGLASPWNGSGSLLEINPEQDIKLPLKYIFTAMPDGFYKWDINEIYGLVGSAWEEDVVRTDKDGNIAFFKSETEA